MVTEESLTREQKQIKLFIDLAVRIFVTHYNSRELLRAENEKKLLTKSAPNFFSFLNELLIRDFFLETAKKWI